MLRDLPGIATDHSVWQAQWIWSSEFRLKEPNYIAFRKEFVLSELPENPVVRLAANENCCLYINGEVVEYGPAISDSIFKRYLIIPVKEYLVEGKNTVAVLAFHGLPQQIPFHDDVKGLLFQLEDEGKILLVSDPAWKVRRNTAYLPHDIYFDTVYYQEHVDYRNFPCNWFMPGFDDSKWLDAVPVLAGKRLHSYPVRPNRFYPWVNLTPQEVTPPERTEIFPVSATPYEVIEKAEPAWSDIAVRNSLDELLALDKCSAVNADKICKGSDAQCKITNSDLYEDDETFDGLHDATIIFDFGKLVNARLNISLDAPAGTMVEITYSETLENNKLISYRCSYTAYADGFVTADGRTDFKNYYWRHFRYIRLTFRNLKDTAVLHKVSAECVNYKFPEEMKWHFDNALLNKSLEATLNTVKLCVYDRTMDNPSRERKSYGGDADTMVNIIDTVYGETALVKKFLIQFDESQYRTGMYRCGYCSPNDGESLYDHNLIYLIRLYDHIMRFNDLDLLKKVMPGVYRAMELTESFINENGVVGDVPYGIWFDWADVGRNTENFLINAMAMKSFEAVSELEKLLNGETPAAKQWKKTAEHIRKYLHDNFFDAKRRAFTDYVDEKGIEKAPVSEHANSLALLWDIADTEQSDQIIAHYEENYKDFSPCSPAWEFLQPALVKCGGTDLLLAHLERRYVPLFNMGRTTFPETWAVYGEKTPGHWRVRNTRSLTQGTGLPLPYTMAAYIAGITPLEAGFAKVKIAPDAGSLKNFTLTIPCPGGTIGMDYERVQDKAVYKVNCTEEKSGVFVLASSVEPQAFFNGKSVDFECTNNSCGGKKLWQFEWKAKEFELEVITGK